MRIFKLTVSRNIQFYKNNAYHRDMDLISFFGLFKYFTQCAWEKNRMNDRLANPAMINKDDDGWTTQYYYQYGMWIGEE